MPVEHLAVEAKKRGARVALGEIAGTDFTFYEVAVSPTGAGYNDYAREVHEACLRKSAANLDIPYSADLDQRCSVCVYSTAMPGIYMHGDGRCNMCHAFERAKAEDARTGRLASELEACLKPGNPDAEFDVVVALSGGKDSSAVLGYVGGECDLRVRAVLADNGFIPDFVKQNCRAMCDSVGASFDVVTFEFASELKKLISAANPEDYPCNTCSKHFKALIADYAIANGCSRIIMGRNFWATLEPTLSGVRNLVSPSGGNVNYYSLPFLLGWSLEDLQPRLAAVGWDERAKGIPGMSTNCTVPGLVEEHFHQTTDLHPEAPLLSNEVICGFISRDQAIADLEIVE